MGELVAAVSLRYAAGKDVTIPFTLTNADGDAVDPTGLPAKFVVARRVGSTAVLSTEDSPATVAIAVTDGVNGEFDVSWAGADAAGLSGTYRFELEMEDESGDADTVAWGYITFDPTLIP